MWTTAGRRRQKESGVRRATPSGRRWTVPRRVNRAAGSANRHVRRESAGEVGLLAEQLVANLFQGLATHFDVIVVATGVPDGVPDLVQQVGFLQHRPQLFTMRQLDRLAGIDLLAVRPVKRQQVIDQVAVREPVAVGQRSRRGQLLEARRSRFRSASNSSRHPGYKSRATSRISQPTARWRRQGRSRTKAAGAGASPGGLVNRATAMTKSRLNMRSLPQRGGRRAAPRGHVSFASPPPSDPWSFCRQRTAAGPSPAIPGGTVGAGVVHSRAFGGPQAGKRNRGVPSSQEPHGVGTVAEGEGPPDGLRGRGCSLSGVHYSAN